MARIHWKMFKHRPKRQLFAHQICLRLFFLFFRSRSNGLLSNQKPHYHFANLVGAIVCVSLCENCCLKFSPVRFIPAYIWSDCFSLKHLVHFAAKRVCKKCKKFWTKRALHKAAFQVQISATVASHHRTNGNVWLHAVLLYFALNVDLTLLAWLLACGKMGMGGGVIFFRRWLSRTAKNWKKEKIRRYQCKNSWTVLFVCRNARRNEAAHGRLFSTDLLTAACT